MTYRELYTILDNERFYIFGTGFVSEIFWRGLEQHGSDKNVLGFLVSDPQRGAVFHGKRVLGLDDADTEKDVTIVAAVHEAVCRELNFDGRNVIRIYPFLSEYLYGAPTDQKILKLDEIRFHQPDDQYWIAVRYAAVKGIVSRDEYLKSLYIRAMSIHASENTALKRMNLLADIVKDVREHGFDRSRTIDITDRFGIIDGLHRIALAAYFGIDGISCRIYRHSDIYDTVLGPTNRLPENILCGNGFTCEDIAVLKTLKETSG